MAKFTLTMARLYADQGYLRKAAEVYRHLIEQHPNRPDIQQALGDIEQRIEQQPVPTKKELSLMYREWIALMRKEKMRRIAIQNDQGGRK
jgi:hypothetical protein